MRARETGSDALRLLTSAAIVMGIAALSYTGRGQVEGRGARPSSDGSQETELTRTERLSSVPLPETLPPRGRLANSPKAIPARGWRAIALRSWAAVEEDRVLAVAAGVTFYLLLALVPAITAFVSIYGLFARRETVVAHLESLSGIIPPETMPVIAEQTTRIASASDATMTFASVFALLVAVWSANGGTKAMIEALNVAYDERESRSFIKLNLIALALTGGAVGLGLCLIAAIAVLPAVLSFVPDAGFAATVSLWLRWPVVMLAMLIGLSILYRFAPDRARARWRWVSPGAVIATFALVPFSACFSIYASRFADFNGTYGSLGALMGFLLWLWVAAIIVLMGAEINSEAEKQTNRDTTTGAPLPMGRRGAEAADKVAL